MKKFKYCPVYKCDDCGMTILRHDGAFLIEGNEDVDITSEDIEEMRAVPRYINHHCGRRRVGVASLIGYREEEG